MLKAIVCKRTSSSRVTASDGDGNRVVYHIDMSDQLEESYDNAVHKLCEKMKWTGRLVKGWIKDGQRVYVWAYTPVQENNVFIEV